ncbi:MAG TPA: 30S ribosomal protein S3 [Candidatus Limnocylindria bacterium]|nr:30S ribosomal protein S3 [Candidatus Limnocylindria bacterium]
MGHKVHPYGFRIGIIKPWLAKWYADRDYATLLQEDMRIRELVARQLANASVSQVEIERGINHVTVTVHTAKPGIVIGKGGANVEALRTNVGKLTNKKVKLEIKEILQPELDGMLLAQNVAGQLERRIAFRKAIKQSIQRTIKAGAKGVKIQVSGRLGGSEMSRTEWDKEGRIPLGTLRADISYGVVHAHTTYGRIGVKAWVYRGEQLGERPGSARTEPRAPRRAAAPARGRRSAEEAPSSAATAVAEPEASVGEPQVQAPVAETAAPDAVIEAVTETPAIEAEAAPETPAPEVEAATADTAEPAKGEAAAEPETKAPAKPKAAAEPAKAPKKTTRTRKAATPKTTRAKAKPAESADDAKPAGEES